MHRDTLFRRATIWLAVTAYALVASGLPLPMGGVFSSEPGSAAAKRLAGKDRSRPFPCMDKPCGCATAEQCFASCCCNTPAELLAWARANRVDPSLLASLAGRVASAEATAAKGSGSCCATPERSACCSEVPRDVAPQHAGHEEVAEPLFQNTVVLMSMLACRGIVDQWLAVGGAPPPPAVAAVVSVAPLVAPLMCGDDVCLVDRVEPEAPPPRVV